MSPISRPVRNFTPATRGAGEILGLVVHDSEGTLAGLFAVFDNPASQASAHYAIDGDGAVYETVPPRHIAWHVAAFGADPSLNRNRPAWLPAYTGRYSAVNASTIGIELIGFAHLGYTPAQYRSLGELCAQLCQEYAIPPTLLPDYGAEAAITTHGWLQTDRTDPGPLFSWALFGEHLHEYLGGDDVALSPDEQAILDVMRGLNANAQSIADWIERIGAQEKVMAEQAQRIAQLEAAAGQTPAFDPYAHRIELVNTASGDRYGYVGER